MKKNIKSGLRLASISYHVARVKGGGVYKGAVRPTNVVLGW